MAHRLIGARRPPRGGHGAEVAHRGPGHAHSRTSADGADPGPSRAGDARSHDHTRRARQAATRGRPGQAPSGRGTRVRAASGGHASARHPTARDAASGRPTASEGARSRDASAGDAATGGCPGRSSRGAAPCGGDSAGRGLSARRAASGRGPVQEQEQAQEEEAERQEEGVRPRARASQPAGARRAGAHRGGRLRTRTIGQRSERRWAAVRAMGVRHHADRHGCAFALGSVVKSDI